MRAFHSEDSEEFTSLNPINWKGGNSMYQLTKEQKIENLQEVKKNLDSKIQNLNKQITDIEKKIQKLQTTKSFI